MDLLFPDRIRQVFRPTPRGIVGLVEDLLALAQHQPLRLDFQDGQCSIRAMGAAGQEAVVAPLPKSATRALLARIATLCNEHRPGSVTPYGGAGAVSLPTDPQAVLRVAFANTPSEQRLELAPVA